jgi:coenzyme PQQ precursor peptide PqqA
MSYLAEHATTGVPNGTITKEGKMAWSTPRVVEICVGMEVTSYESAE